MKPTTAKIYSNIALYLTFAQSLLPTLGLSETASMLVTSFVLAAISVFSKLSQKANREVNDKAQVLLNILIAVAILGFINDVFSVIKLDNKWMNIARIAIAFAINYTNVIAKNLFPTDTAKALQQKEEELKRTNFFSNN